MITEAGDDDPEDLRKKNTWEEDISVEKWKSESNDDAARDRAIELASRMGIASEVRVAIQPKGVALFPSGSFVPGCECGHRGKIRAGSNLVCMVCHQSGNDGHPALVRSKATDPKPEPEFDKGKRNIQYRKCGSCQRHYVVGEECLCVQNKRSGQPRKLADNPGMEKRRTRKFPSSPFVEGSPLYELDWMPGVVFRGRPEAENPEIELLLDSDDDSIRVRELYSRFRKATHLVVDALAAGSISVERLWQYPDREGIDYTSFRITQSGRDRLSDLLDAEPGIKKFVSSSKRVGLIR